ncbi:hypothetical protein ACK8HY_13875 [Sphingobacterium sp. NGMCC 1.201703]|uniref:hypothetical protein n=1 Tax=Sphingobacterium sp. NGMCC 1.201703 TaxID=3388657 RepID=UPI0039FCD563
MNKNAKKMYVAPSIVENVVELEQGIAAGSGNAAPGNSPTLNEEEGAGGSGWNTDGF